MYTGTVRILSNSPAYQDMFEERIRAHKKHDGHGGSMERKNWDAIEWLSVLVEEVGEVAKAQCDARHQLFETEEEYAAHLREELVQVGAMTAAWIDAIDRDF